MSLESKAFDVSALITERVSRWNLNRQATKVVGVRGVYRIVDMETSKAFHHHSELWEVLKKRSGWARNMGDSEVEFSLMTSSRTSLVTARLPLDLNAVSPSALRKFVRQVNELQHAEIFDVWLFYGEASEASRPSLLKPPTSGNGSSHSGGSASLPTPST